MKVVKWLKRKFQGYAKDSINCSHGDYWEVKRKYLQNFVQCNICGERVYDGTKNQFFNKDNTLKSGLLEQMIKYEKFADVKIPDVIIRVVKLKTSLPFYNNCKAEFKALIKSRSDGGNDLFGYLLYYAVELKKQYEDLNGVDANDLRLDDD